MGVIRFGCGTGSQGKALERLGVHDYDVLVLDRDLPGTHGDEVCAAVVERGLLVRVLMLTAASDVRARVAGLSLGADDYLPKPFAFEELVARVHALGRRARKADPPMLERAGIRLDWAHRQAFRDGRYVPLARKEFGVLAELLRAQGAVVSAEELLEKVWDEHIDLFTHTVRTTMTKLRKKLGPPQVIETLPDRGTASPEHASQVRAGLLGSGAGGLGPRGGGARRPARRR